jgi:hypothetical protein
MQFILVILLLIGFSFIIKWTYELDKHYKWFNLLKPGDTILVTIFSENCDCKKEAMVIEEPVGKYVEAQLSTDEKSKCKSCDKANDSCFYDNITSFHRNTINKLPE